jgi:WD40 repeat protein
LVGRWDGTVVLWEALTGQKRQILQGHTAGVYQMWFSRDGRRALTGSADDKAMFWELGTGRCLQIFKGHTNNITGVFCDEDKGMAITTSADATVRLWDIQSGKELCQMIAINDGKDWLGAAKK